MVKGGENEKERKVDEKMIKITTKGRGTKGGPEPTPEDEFQKNYMGGGQKKGGERGGLCCAKRSMERVMLELDNVG